MQSETIHFYATQPQHHGEMLDATIVHTESNRICGDIITVYLRIQNNSVQKWSFSGDVSMITLACSGLFGDIIQGKELSAIMQWNQKIIIDMTGIEVSPRRKRAQVLALLATRNALHAYLQDGQKDDFSDIIVEV